MQYSKKEIALIKSSYAMSNGSLAKAAEHLEPLLKCSITPTTIKKYWKEEGYKVTHLRRDSPTTLTEEEIRLVLRRFDMYGSVAKTAKALSLNPATVKKYLTERGVLGDNTDNGLEGRVL